MVFNYFGTMLYMSRTREQKLPPFPGGLVLSPPGTIPRTQQRYTKVPSENDSKFFWQKEHSENKTGTSKSYRPVKIKKENNLISSKNDPYLDNSRPVQFSKSIGVRRPLSGGELFSLLLLIASIFLSLALGVFIAFLRGGNLNFIPSWLI